MKSRPRFSLSIRSAMPALDMFFPRMMAALADHYGQPKTLVEGLSPFEAVVAVGLSKAGDRTRIGVTLTALNEASLLRPEALAAAEPAEIGDVLRDAGISVPGKTVQVMKRLARWFKNRNQDLDESPGEVGLSTAQLREELVGLNGIGLATADAILLHALGRSSYPVDRASYRILVRHGWIDPTADYEEASQLLVRQAPEQPQELARLSNWLVQVGREYCRSSAPKCQDCPLRCLLPEDGPRKTAD
jgi:endonuclease III related protein